MNKLSQKHNYVIFLVMLISAASLGYFVTDVYIPALPIIARSLDVPNEYTQLTITTYFLTFSIIPVFAGPLSDRLGRKKVICFGLLVALVASFVCYMSPDIYTLMFARAGQGFGLGCVTIAARSIAPDTFKDEQLAKTMSMITMTMPLFLAIAPTIGGYIAQHFSWNAVFLFICAYITLVFIYYLFVFENSNTPQPEHNLLSSINMYAFFARNKVFMLYGIYPVMTFSSIIAYITISPFLFQDLLGLTASEYGYLSLLNGAVIVLCGFINTKLIKRFKSEQLMLINMYVLLSAGIVLYCLYLLKIVNFYALLVPCLMMFAALPFGFPNSYALAYKTVKSHYGTAGSLLTCIQLLSGFLVSAIFSYMPEDSFQPLAITFILSGIGSIILSRLAMKAGKSAVIV